MGNVWKGGRRTESGCGVLGQGSDSRTAKDGECGKGGQGCTRTQRFPAWCLAGSPCQTIPQERHNPREGISSHSDTTDPLRGGAGIFSSHTGHSGCLGEAARCSCEDGTCSPPGVLGLYLEFMPCQGDEAFSLELWLLSSSPVGGKSREQGMSCWVAPGSGWSCCSGSCACSTGGGRAALCKQGAEAPGKVDFCRCSSVPLLCSITARSCSNQGSRP